MSAMRGVLAMGLILGPALVLAESGFNLTASGPGCPGEETNLQQDDLNFVCNDVFPDEGCAAEPHGTGGDCWKCNCGGEVKDPGNKWFEGMKAWYRVLVRGHENGCPQNKCNWDGAQSDCQACFAYVVCPGECQ
jgi:hypothetical protein